MSQHALSLANEPWEIGGDHEEGPGRAALYETDLALAQVGLLGLEEMGGHLGAEQEGDVTREDLDGEDAAEDLVLLAQQRDGALDELEQAAHERDGRANQGRKVTAPVARREERPCEERAHGQRPQQQQHLGSVHHRGGGVLHRCVGSSRGHCAPALHRTAPEWAALWREARVRMAAGDEGAALALAGDGDGAGAGLAQCPPGPA